MNIRRAVLLVPIVLASCDREPAESPERIAARQAAARDACVAEELVVRARENATELERFAAGTGPHTFAVAYREIAELRYASAAYADSAARAESAADSARYAERRKGVTPSAPAAETLEATIAQAYARDAARILANPAHTCNQEAAEAP